MFDIRKMLRKAVCIAVIAGMCFSFTGCFTILRAVAEVNAEDKVKDFLDAFFEDPGAVDFDEYIEAIAETYDYDYDPDDEVSDFPDIFNETDEIIG